MVKAVFLDRDGVINEDVDHLHRKEDFAFIPRAPQAIKLLNENGYTVIVITNQTTIARGICLEEDVVRLNRHMTELLSQQGAKIDAVYYCPHHPDPEKAQIRKYNIDCECRKPKPGMIFQAQRDFQISDLSESYMIGDKTSDIKAGFLAGCKTILVETGYGGSDNLYEVTPDYIASDLYSAVSEVILKQMEK